MTKDLTRGFADETTQHEVALEPSAVVTIASETSTETNLALAGDAELAGAEGTETLSGQVRIEVGKPVAGETLVIEAQAGETYVLDFPADETRAFAEGDDLILAFEDGSRIVFEGLVNLAQLENGPRLEYGGEDLMPLLIAQGIIPGVLGTFELTEPQPGETIVISAAEGQVYGVQFDPSAVQILVDDNDLILVFANGGRIIIENLGAFADSPNAPVFDIAGTEVPGPTLYFQAVALGEEAAPPTFATVETAATGEPQGTGETRYSDDFGDTIPLIDPQGVIPPVFLEFGLINPEPAEIINIEDEPPQADPVLTPAERGQDGENIPEALASALSQLGGSGTLFFSQDNNPNGLYSINVATGEATLVGAGTTNVTSNTVGLAPGEPGSGLLFGSIWFDIVEINDDGSGATVLAGSEEAEGLAYDPNSDTLYGAINGDFFTIDPATGLKLVDLSSPGQDVEGLAFAGDGTIYGLADGGDLLSYDIGTDTWTVVGNTGINFDSIGLAFDPNTNTLYAVGDQDFNLYSIDPSTADTTLVGPTGLDGGSFTNGGGLAYVSGTGGASIDPSSVVFFKELTVDSAIGDDDDPQADFGGADLETALGDLTFTLLSDPTYGTLILVTSGGDVSELNVGDTFTSEDTVWWIATENQVSAFLEANPDLNGILPDVEFNYMVTDEADNTATAPVTITVDDAPSIGEPEPAVLDEDGEGGEGGIAGLPGSNPGGPGDDVPPEPKGVIFSGNLDYDFGGDGAGDVSFADLDGDPVVDQALTPVTSAGATLTWEWDAATHTLTAINDSTQQPVLTLQVTNVDTGDYTVTLLAQLDHPATDADGDNDGPETAWEDEIVFDLPFVVSDVEGDTAEGSVLVTVDDDSPIESGQTESETVEEDDLNNAQSVGNNEDLSVNAHIATGSIAGLVLDGADEDATFGVAADTSGLPALLSKGESVVYDVTGDTLTAYVESGDAGGLDGADRVVFTLQVQSNGDYTFTLVDQLDHEDDGNDDENTVLQLDGGGTVGSIDFSSVIEATDFDGDTITLTAGAFTITVEDDVPIVLASTDLIYSNANNGDGGGTGVFDYSIGADERINFSTLNSDFSAITLSGTVGGVAISSPTVTWASEDLTMAEFDISFFYAPNPDAPGETVEATGTLTFDKVNGTYTVVLDEPIESFTVLTTSDALGFQGYEPGSANEDNSGPADVVVAQLSNDFFVQFTGIVEPGGGTGSDNLFTVGDGSPGDFTDGDLFSQNLTSVTVSSVAAGVAGNTIQKGEVLDMDFFTFDPQGFTALDPDARVTDVFFKFDGINSEDLVIVLKLVSSDGLTTTTKAIIVDNEDILTLGDPIPSGFGITLDNNDGVVIIESNDYNFGSEDWVIEGAQVLVSVEGVTGEGIDLNGATGDSGGSSETLVAFDAGDTDNDVIKIIDIGFVTAETDTEDADLTFDFSLIDADGDETAPQSLDVTIEGGSTLTGTDAGESIEGDAGMETLIGNGGDDILTGGSDADTFVFSLAVNEGSDVITDFDFSDGDVLSFTDVVDIGGPAGIDVTDVVAAYADGGAPGAVDTITLASGTVISVTDVDDAFSSAADVFNNSLINGA